MDEANVQDAPANMEKGPAAVRPDLYVQWSDDDNYWSVDSNPSANPKRKLKPLVFDVAEAARDIVIELRPPHGQAWTFRRVNGGPISSRDNSPCPIGDGNFSDQIANIRLSNNDTVLTITNQNSDAARLVRYKLHINGAPLPECDPAILNGGGGSN